jgi:hypothetical protein
MVSDELLSFREHFWPSHFPIEARYYEYRASGPSLILRTRRISTPEELRAFQEDVTRREQLHEWSFLAYYEPFVQQQDESVSSMIVTTL